MIKCYLTIVEGALPGRVFQLEGRSSVGRGKTNEIRLSNESVSRRHATVSLEGDQSVVEDLASHNGTFVNGQKVKKAVLRSGDTIRFGAITLRFLQEEVQSDAMTLTETHDGAARGPSRDEGESEVLARSRRLMAVLGKTSLFKDLEPADLNHLSRAARLRAFPRGRSIARNDDRNTSLFVILDGKVVIHRPEGDADSLPLAYLSEGGFFGEMGLLTGASLRVSARAAEDCLIAELTMDSVRTVIARRPAVRASLLGYYRKRVRRGANKREMQQTAERRKHPRFKARLRVSLTVAPGPNVSGQFLGRSFSGISSDISISGMRIVLEDSFLMGLPIGCQLNLDVQIPDFHGPLRAIARVRNIVEHRGEGGEIYSVGVGFAEVGKKEQRAIEAFLLSLGCSQWERTDVPAPPGGGRGPDLSVSKVPVGSRK